MNIPIHVAIILDGNGRWATDRGLPRSKGHDAGFKNLEILSEYIFKKGTKYLSVFAFSTENFKRSEEEVNHLMNMFSRALSKNKNSYKEKNIKVLFSGRDKPLRDDIISSMQSLEEYTKECTGGVFNICINYGGQAEYVDATKKISKDVLDGVISTEDINEDLIYKYLYNDLPPVDLMIRTSGEKRISNFMLYQLAYAELYFPKVYFPDFNNEEYDKALIEYNNRNRRFGAYNKN